MSETPSVAIRLFGTDEAVVPPRTLRAGPLTAELEAGNLRYIRFNGVEMLRAISFIVRDRNWGTYNPQISNLEIAEDPDGFRVSYDAVTRDAAQEFSYRAVIAGRADGSLSFEGRGTAVTDFVTNRTGFVVLHPIVGVAGEPAEIETVDGRITRTRFPSLIDPVQPMMNLRGITHAFAPGAYLTCRMEGDTYEMEDQRNWTDASYKTYVRPLALPWPYMLPKGSILDQAVSLTVKTTAPCTAKAGEAVAVRLGATVGKAPRLGLGLDPDDAAAALQRAEPLAAADPAYLICRHDPRRGHNRETLASCLEVAKALGTEPWLEAIIVSVDGFEDEVAKLGETIAALGSPFRSVLVSPAPDLKCVLPGSPWPPCPPAADVYGAARRAFPGARLGGGMFSYFTELNRKRPPADLIDFVSFTTSAMVHAGDDRSVTEGLESLPQIAASVRAFIGDRPYAVGPSAIGMRDNPYGAAPMANPNNIRQAMNRNDPRQRGLLGAAWALAYFAHFTYGGAEAVALGGLVGPLGLVHAPAAFPQPWFDREGGLFPVFHVFRGLSRVRGAMMRALDISAPRDIQGLCVERSDGRSTLWLANLTGETREVALDPAFARASLATLDAENFVAATKSASALDKETKLLASSRIALGPYAAVRLNLS